MDTLPALATVVIVSRERFSIARQTVENLLANTDERFSMIYMDGGGPKSLGDYLATVKREGGFDVIRRDYYLSANEARNIGFSRVKTKYAAFVDNDVMMEPGWLELLVRCAEEQDAAVVGPLYLDGNPEDEIVHMAGGEACIRESDGVVSIYENQKFRLTPLKDVNWEACRGPTDVVEFHCILVAGKFLKSMGGFDEGFLNIHEHVDFCLSVRKAGGGIYLEPATKVTYLLGSGPAAPPHRFSWPDIPFYLLRWSEAWSRSTLEHANAKWGLTEDHQYFINTWLNPHRRRALMPFRRWARRCLGQGLGDRAMDILERRIASRCESKRPAAQATSERKSSNLPLGSRGISST